MQYPYTAIATMLFIVSCIALCSSYDSTQSLSKKSEDEKNTEFAYEHDDITFDDILAASPDKIDMIDMKDDEVIKPEPPKWRHTYYGNTLYAVDENGYYHDRQGRVWRPIRVDTTAYTWKDDGNDPSIGAGDGKTATGKDAKRTYGIASGSPLVPYGSTIHVSGYGQFEVDDTGGRLKREWTRKGKIRLDLRIPQLRYDGVWRSIRTARAIAFKHGVRRNRTVLLLVRN